MNICKCCGQQIIEIPGMIHETVLYAVARYFKIKIEDLKIKSRKREIVYPRHVAYYFLRKESEIGTPSIGRIFNQDHATVIHGAQLMKSLYKTSFDVRYDIDKIEGILKRIQKGEPEN